MAVVTGDRYLNSLVNFVERNAEPLIEGNLTLKLNPVGLHYVQCRLESLQELERLLAGAPVDYLRAYVSDLGDHRALEQLRRILRLLTSLKVISVLAPPLRDPTPLSLLPFGRLKVLELRGCDLSSSTARGLLELRHTLEKLICHNSTDALRHVFASRLVDIKDSPPWNKLSFVSCSCNGLILMDESLQLLPAVETLDLSRNHFAKLDNLRKCTELSHLDLGFNHLRTISSLSEVSCRIIKLVLRNNALSKLWGIENLRSVEALDISYNLLSTFSELEILASLPSLHSVWLEGNPICSARWYRGHFFSLFSLPEKIKLDDQGISRKECWQRHVIIAGRRKRPPGYGFYFPAKEKAEADERSRTSATRRKVLRIASIQDEQKRRARSGEEHDKKSKSCDTDNQRIENGKIEEESEIKSLMNRAESVMKEKSVLWMDQSVDDLNAKPSNSKKHIKLEDLVFVGSNDSLDPIIQEGKDRDDYRRCSSFASIQEVINSRQSSLSPLSPPHYQKDMLHSRQNIEKFLQLPDEAFLVTSSESDVSPSDDDSCESRDSYPEHSQLFKRASMKGIIVEEHVDFLIEDGMKEKSKGDCETPRMSCLERSNSLLDRNAQIERYFSMHLADSTVFESCLDLTCCGWISEGPNNREREVAVLVSTDQKVYVLLIDESYEGLGMISRVVGCHKFQEIEEVIIGLESQALRVTVKGDMAHIFLTRSAESLEKLLYLFHVFDSSGYLFKCWEQIQVEFFDEYVCGGLRLNIFLYAMLCLYKDDEEGHAWIPRSLFMVEGYLFLCIEDIKNFGKSEELSAKNPYYSLDSCWPIERITNIVIEEEKSKCLTLILGQNQSKKREKMGTSLTDCFHDRHHHDDDDHNRQQRWRLRWPSHEALRRFVALVKALHSELATSPIRIEVVSSSP